MSIIEIKDVKKNFHNLEVLKGVSFDAEKGEVVSIIGPSGGGKSTLLRCLNGLETYDSGSIRVIDEDLKEIKDINSFRQKVGMVFQQFNLFANMNVLDNCIFAQTKALKRNKEEAKKVALENLKKVGMEKFAAAYPNTLSGGQKQRVAIARAISMNPQILLFDEPTSALDPEMVEEVLNVIRSLVNEGLTMVIVSHEIDFVRDISDKIVFMDEGIVMESGSPKEIFTNPKNERTKVFLRKVLRN